MDKVLTAGLGPWNPGINSSIPQQFLPLSTMYRAENVSTSLDEARELSRFCGLQEEQLVRFRPQRLVLHEVLIRVMADLVVDDGRDYGDLGINFRAMTSAIMGDFITPAMPSLVAVYDDLTSKTETRMRAILDEQVHCRGRQEDAQPQQVPGGLLGWLGLGKKTSKPGHRATERQDDATRLKPVIADWRETARTAHDAFERAIAEALATTITGILNTQGRLIGDAELIVKPATTIVANTLGSVQLGEAVAPIFDTAVTALGFRRLPVQAKPIVMNVKGASAAGKSTLRPKQKALASRIGVAWEDFALISPDIWRKYLLDYDSLGEASRYAGSLTGHEVRIIDLKLDRYMAEKGARQQISHLLIDRFRFDSFATNPDEEDGGRLLTRFGELVYMYFMITPPEETVERAYKRGEKYGRYKAVDDLLDHNVEAYSGMPQLFFTWAMREGKRVHCEFLDNSVELGELPRTVAFGWNGEMNVLDVERLIAVDRYCKINIDAHSRKEVYQDEDRFRVENNLTFLTQCCQTIPVVNFADQHTGKVYARLENGELVMLQAKGFEAACRSQDIRTALQTVLHLPEKARDTGAAMTLSRKGSHTLGAWGDST